MMTHLDIAHMRLSNQHLTQQLFEKPVDVVQWLGAVQSQDYAAATWALALRLQNATSNDIEQAFNDGSLLRTHVMRPTWHFVSPADIRWLLALTAPRVNAGNASYYRKFELDDAIFSHCNAVLTKALQGGRQLTRAELVSALKLGGIESEDPLRFGLIVMHAELDGIICSGAKRGKQFTYALLEERVPQTRTLDRDEALAALASRYFTSHGPATLQDFIWWSGLAASDARAGLTMVESQFVSEIVDDQAYWFSPATPNETTSSPTTYLLPNYDEYIVSYKDRSAIFDASNMKSEKARDNIIFSHTMILDGRIVGTWKRTEKKEAVTLTTHPLTSLDDADLRAFAISANCYGEFLEKPVNITFPTK